MTALTDTAPAYIWQTRNPDAPKLTMFYYGTDHSAPQTVGTEYGVVYSPNPYADPGSEWRDWRYVVFQVVRVMHHGKLATMQAEKAKRLLMVDEVAYFENLLADYVSESEDVSDVHHT